MIFKKLFNKKVKGYPFTSWKSIDYRTECLPTKKGMFVYIDGQMIFVKDLTEDDLPDNCEFKRYEELYRRGGVGGLDLDE